MAEVVPPRNTPARGKSLKGSAQAPPAGGPQGPSGLEEASHVARTLLLRQAGNGVRFASMGDIALEPAELERIVSAVPHAIPPALQGRAFYFVPLVLVPERKGGGRVAETLVAPVYTPELADDAICHRDLRVGARTGEPAHEATFISARLLQDKFSLAFEYFINVAHQFADGSGVPAAAADLFWSQALLGVRGESSQDAWEARAEALPAAAPEAREHGSRRAGPASDRPAAAGSAQPNEKARLDFVHAAFADALAIYMLSLAVDFDYAELREREYPLLAPAALAERLRLMATLFPPDAGYEFSIRYRRR